MIMDFFFFLYYAPRVRLLMEIMCCKSTIRIRIEDASEWHFPSSAFIAKTTSQGRRNVTAVQEKSEMREPYVQFMSSVSI